ncbi:hypothetical protein BEN47_16435 [Hymenobacter lapidarius]|uniref:Uncharacterized protein n=1 Tax=Hymenobacter lapidarius TaxID=1908237 RepID=A0A1G1T057_9BACT|nr:hypothetical protein [Hymenobacter lapidarius]OGX84241.1 hypothetical protein BEN47_16435 [Hymenobacter lapidarius]
MKFQQLLRPFAVACILTATLSACSSGTKEGDTNVERGRNKDSHVADGVGVVGGDSATAGLVRDTARTVTGRDLYKAAGEATDRNHDGIAD